MCVMNDRDESNQMPRYLYFLTYSRAIPFMQVIVSGVWVTGFRLKRIHFVLLVLIRRWRLSKNCSIEVKLSLRLEAAVFGEDPTEYKMVSSA